MIKVIATDLDGTLLDENHELNQVTYEALKKAEAQGIRIIIATGRDFSSVNEIFGKFNLTCDFLVLSGAEMRSSKGVILSSISMDVSDFPEIIKIAEDRELSVRFCCGGEDYFISSESNLLEVIKNEMRIFSGGREIEDLEKSESFHGWIKRTRHIETLSELIELGVPVYKLFISGADTDVIKEVEQIYSEFPGIASASSFATNIELTHKGAQKGLVLKQYIENLGYKMDEVMVIGDSMNDYSMISMDFGITVAMENAMEEIKKTAGYITKSNQDNGVVFAIEKFCLTSS